MPFAMTRASTSSGRLGRSVSCQTGSHKPYSITPSARARRDAGISMLSDFAVLRLMTSRNLVENPPWIGQHRERSDEAA
jgi:hypothetical protein